MAERGTSVAVINNTRTVWSTANKIAESIDSPSVVSEDIRLVQDFLRTEISPDFELIRLLDRGVGVHHAGLSDEVRSLIEWLTESGNLRVLCTTTTLAQGINFPVSSVFLMTTGHFDGNQMVDMAPREFWNLAGRAGRLDHDSVGVVGIAAGTRKKERAEFIARNTTALVSRLVTLLDELATQGELHRLSEVLWQDQWEDFRCYVAHLWAEKKDLDAVLAETEDLLRCTYGYTVLRSTPSEQNKAAALLKATRAYAYELADMRSGIVELADSTGFSPEGVRRAMSGINQLEHKLVPSDWTPDSLFGDGRTMADLFGVMLRIPQLKQALDDIGGEGTGHARIASITRDWVNGHSLNDIASTYFMDKAGTSITDALTATCRAIYRAIVNNATWGLSAFAQVSGMDFTKLSEEQQRTINMLPGMIYHGVRSEDAVLMRVNSVPRSAAESLGAMYRDVFEGEATRFSVGKARTFLKKLSSQQWEEARPQGATLSGNSYRRVWQILSGEVG